MPESTGPRSGALSIELVPHLDAGDRARWSGDQDQRPLSELGRRQAAVLADLLMEGSVDALYSSPARRCRQTIEPLAAWLGLPITVLPELRETDTFSPPSEWVGGFYQPIAPLLGGAYAAGRARAALRRMATDHRQGRVIACSHGDTIPAAVAFLVGAHGLAPPPPLERRGGWYTVRLDGERVSVEARSSPPDFPA